MAERKVSVTVRLPPSGVQFLDRKAGEHGVDRTLELAARLAVAMTHESEVDREVARRKSQRRALPT